MSDKRISDKTSESSNASAESQSAVDSRRFRLGQPVDPIAIVALFLALCSTTWHLIGFFRGASTSLYMPETVEVRASRAGWLTVQTQMSYANKGRVGYNDVVSSEIVRVRVTSGSPSTPPLRLNWQSFVTTDHGPRNEIRIDKDAHPFIVPGSGAVSHQTSFFPRSEYCEGCDKWGNYLKWSDFVDQLNTADKIYFEFVADILDGERVVRRCSMPIDDRAREYMKDNGLFTRTCVPENGS